MKDTKKGFSTIVIMLIVISVAVVGLSWYQVSSRDTAIDPEVEEEREYGVSDIVYESDNVMEYMRESFRTSTLESVRDISIQGGRPDQVDGENYWACRGFEQVPRKDYVHTMLENQTAENIRHKLENIGVPGAEVENLYPYNIDERDVEITEINPDTDDGYDEMDIEIDIGDFQIASEDTEIELQDVVIDESITHNRFFYMHDRLKQYFEDYGIERIEDHIEYELSKVPNIHKYDFGRNSEYDDESNVMFFPAYTQGHGDMMAWRECAERGTEAPMHINEDHPDKIRNAVENARNNISEEIEETYMDDSDIDCHVKPKSNPMLQDPMTGEKVFNPNHPYPGIRIDGWTTFPHTENVDSGVACLPIGEIVQKVGEVLSSGAAAAIRPIVEGFVDIIIESILGGSGGDIDIHVCAGGQGGGSLVEDLFGELGLTSIPLIGDVIEAFIDALMSGDPKGCYEMSRHLIFHTWNEFEIVCEDSKYQAVPREPRGRDFSQDMAHVRWEVGVGTTVEEESFDENTPDHLTYEPDIDDDYRVDPAVGDGTNHYFTDGPTETICEIDTGTLSYEEPTGDDSTDFGQYDYDDQCEEGETFENLRYLTSTDIVGSFHEEDFEVVNEIDDDNCEFEREEGDTTIYTEKEDPGGAMMESLETEIVENGNTMLEQELVVHDPATMEVDLEHREYEMVGGSRELVLHESREGNERYREEYIIEGNERHQVLELEEEGASVDEKRWEVIGGEQTLVYELSRDSANDYSEEIYYHTTTEEMANRTYQDMNNAEITWSEWDEDGECELDEDFEPDCECVYEMGEDRDDECY